MYIGNANIYSQVFYGSSKSTSIFFIVFIIVYGTGRWFFNVLGGLYMYKRMALAAILAASFIDNRMLAPLLVMEVVFLIARYIIESP